MGFFHKLRDIINRQYSEQSISSVLKARFMRFARQRDIHKAERTEEYFVKHQELHEFFTALGMDDEKDETLINEFIKAIDNPQLQSQVPLLMRKPTLESLRNIVDRRNLLPASALVSQQQQNRQAMVSMRTVLFNFKNFDKQLRKAHEAINQKKQNQLAKMILLHLNPWKVDRAVLESNLTSWNSLEDACFVAENFSQGEYALSEIFAAVSLRNEAIANQLTISAFLRAILLRENPSDITYALLERECVRCITAKAAKLALLQSFVEPFFAEFAKVGEGYQPQSSFEDGLSLVSSTYSLPYSSPVIATASLPQLAQFIYSLAYEQSDADIIIKAVKRIAAESSEDNNLVTSTALEEYIKNQSNQSLRKATTLSGFMKTVEESAAKLPSASVLAIVLDIIRRVYAQIEHTSNGINDILNHVQHVLFDQQSLQSNFPVQQSTLDRLFFKKPSPMTFLEGTLSKLSIFQHDFVLDMFSKQQVIRDHAFSRKKHWATEVNSAIQMFEMESKQLLQTIGVWVPTPVVAAKAKDPLDFGDDPLGLKKKKKKSRNNSKLDKTTTTPMDSRNTSILKITSDKKIPAFTDKSGYQKSNFNPLVSPQHSELSISRVSFMAPLRHTQRVISMNESRNKAAAAAVNASDGFRSDMNVTNLNFNASDVTKKYSSNMGNIKSNDVSAFSELKKLASEANFRLKPSNRLDLTTYEDRKYARHQDNRNLLKEDNAQLPPPPPIALILPPDINEKPKKPKKAQPEEFFTISQTEEFYRKLHEQLFEKSSILPDISSRLPIKFKAKGGGHTSWHVGGVISDRLIAWKTG